MTRIAIVAIGLSVCAVLSANAIEPDVMPLEARRIATVEKAAKSVVAIFSPDGKGGGSGVVVSPDGFALTNYHVVQPCGTAMKCGMADGRIYDAVLVGIDPTGDVAMIKLFGRDDFPAATLADSDEVRVGDEVFAMGNPFMLATDLQPTVTRGIISGTHRYQFPAGTLLEYADCFQTDAAINPGNSGGPLFDDRARVVGINGRCSFEKRGRVSVGVGYSISINQIKKFLGHLGGGMVADHATLGATAAFDADGRVYVDDILEDSDAYRRGLRYGDEIVRFAGRMVDSPNALKNILGTLPAGWRVPLDFRRDGRRHEILVRLAGVHARGELLEKLKAKPRLPMQPEPKDKEGGKKDENDKKPAELNPDQRTPLPAVVKDHFRKKHGYANYYFNISNRKRVVDAWKARIKSDRDAGGDAAWTYKALSRSNKTFVIGKNLPKDDRVLAALALWRRLVTAGPNSFGNVHYSGTFPLYRRGEPPRNERGDVALADVLAGLTPDSECRFYFDRKTHDLAALEIFSVKDGGDPCEIYFEDYCGADGRWRPNKIVIRRGDKVLDVFVAFQPGRSDRTAGVAAARLEKSAGSATGVAPDNAAETAAVRVIRDAQKRVVKIQGAGGFRRLEAYQSGLLISPGGHVLTAMSSVLDTDDVEVTLDDGRRLKAVIVGADPGIDVAVLKVEASALPYFDLDDAARLQTGAGVFALSNLFGVAVGNEPVSVQEGVVAADTRLTAGLGVFETPYHGPTYVLDAATNNPGAAGGALVDRRGRFVGMLGKELQNKLNSTWLNYALPAAELKKSVERILSGRFSAESQTDRQKADTPIDLKRLGIAMVPDILQRTPPYVDAVRPGSAAEKAGLRADDLIVLVGDRLVQSCKAVADELSYMPAGSSLHITVIRGREMIELGIK